MRRHTNLKWERVGDTHDLRVTNAADVNRRRIERLLQNVEKERPDFRKRFSSRAAKYFRKWLGDLERPLPDAAYCLLSNWFLGHGPARTKTRAYHAGILWDALFCVRPSDRLTDWRISERKVAHEQIAIWNTWWQKQQDCQKDC